MALQEEFEQQGNWLFRYRSVLPVIILFAGIAAYIHTELHPETFILEETPYEIYYEIGCLLISLAGLFVRVYTVGHTPAGTSGRNTSEGQLANCLNTTGSYSLVRHPLYLGNFLMWFGISLLTANLWFIVTFCLVFFLYYERIMYAEEQFLRKKFGKAYTDWAEQTPAFFPKLHSFRKPTLSFSWKKVVKKEKNGLLALFLIFAGLDCIGEWVEKQTNYNWVLLTMCFVSLLAYGVLKYLKKKTDILCEEGR